MEIQALLAPTATPTAPKAVDVSAGEEFTALLQSAEGALGTDGSPPLLGALPTGEVAETEPIAPPQTLDPVQATLSLPISNPIVAATPAAAVGAPVPPVVGSAASAAASASVIPTPAPMKPAGFPEPPMPMKVTVQVVEVEPFAVPKMASPEVVAPESGAPESLTPALGEEAPTLDPTAVIEAAPTEEEPGAESEGSESEPQTSSPESKTPIRTDATGRSEVPLRAEAVSKPETARPELRLDTHNVVRELANRIELMAAAKAPQGVVVHLEPADLGSITLLVKPESGGGVSAQMGASNDHVRQALEGSQATLQRQLELRGVIVSSVSVTAETSNQNPQRQSQQHPGYQPQGFHAPASHRAPQYGSSDPVARPSRLKAAGVDLWI